LTRLSFLIKDKPYSPVTDLMDQWNITTKASYKTSDLIRLLEDSTISAYQDDRM
jgi:hypothetical protein